MLKNQVRLSVFGAILVSFFLIFLVVRSGFADDDKSADGKAAEFHKKWSERTLKFADHIDGFFGDERIEEDAQRTRVRVRIDAGYEDEGGSLGASLSARISLPRAENKWALVIGDLDADEDEADYNTDDDKVSSGIGLRFTPKSSLRKQFSLDIGFRKPDDHYELYLRGRHRYTIPHDKWITRFDNRLWLYSSFGWEFDGKLYFDRPTEKMSLFRSRTRLRWFEDVDKCNQGVCPEQSFSFFQNFKSPKHALAYEWYSFFESNPLDGSEEHLSLSYLRLRYRHTTRWDWLFMEYRPRVNFDREDDYDATYDFIIRFEGIFGYKPRYPTLKFGPEGKERKKE